MVRTRCTSEQVEQRKKKTSQDVSRCGAAKIIRTNKGKPIDWFLPLPEYHITPQLGARAIRSLRAIFRRNYLALGAVKGRLFSDHDGSWDDPGFLPLGKKTVTFCSDATHGPRTSLSASRASALSSRSLASFFPLPFWDRVIGGLPHTYTTVVLTRAWYLLVVPGRRTGNPTCHFCHRAPMHARMQ